MSNRTKPQVPVDLTSCNELELVNIMVEGRSIHIRRAAKAEYLRRTCTNSSKVHQLENDLLYYKQLDEQRVNYSSLHAHRVFMVAMSRTEALVYDEPRCTVHNLKLRHSSEYRTSLLLLLDAINLCGVEAQFYTYSEYLYSNVRTNIHRWASNGYRLLSQNSLIKNVDVIQSIVDSGLDFSNIMQLTTAHDTIVRYMQDVYSKQYLYNQSCYYNNSNNGSNSNNSNCIDNIDSSNNNSNCNNNNSSNSSNSSSGGSNSNNSSNSNSSSNNNVTSMVYLCNSMRNTNMTSNMHELNAITHKDVSSGYCTDKLGTSTELAPLVTQYSPSCSFNNQSSSVMTGSPVTLHLSGNSNNNIYIQQNSYLNLHVLDTYSTIPQNQSREYSE